MHPMVRLSDLHLFLRTLVLPLLEVPVLLGFVSILSLFFLFKHIISSKVMDEPLYTIVTLFLLKGFCNVGHPPFEFYEK